MGHVDVWRERRTLTACHWKVENHSPDMRFSSDDLTWDLMQELYIGWNEITQLILHLHYLAPRFPPLMFARCSAVRKSVRAPWIDQSFNLSTKDKLLCRSLLLDIFWESWTSCVKKCHKGANYTSNLMKFAVAWVILWGQKNKVAIEMKNMIFSVLWRIFGVVRKNCE